MSTTRPKTLPAFVRAARNRQPSQVILGNEAADLDSIVSAIALAHLTPASPPPTPVINIPRAELGLRRDALLALDEAGIAPADLTFIDETRLDDASLTLVDHNALAAHQQSFASRVVGVIDHHADENQFHSARPRVVERVGSCSTLVSEEGSPAADTARLLLCAILLDCSNMEPGGKGTPRDAQAVRRLAPIAGWDATARGEVYASLKKARKDFSGFSVADLLLRDVKVIEAGGHRVAVSSVGLSASNLSTRETCFAAAVERFRMRKDVDCVVVMNSYGGIGGHCREMCILKGTLGDAISGRVVQEEELQLDPLRIDGAEGLWCFKQANARASRKVVAPILKQLLRDIEAAAM